MRTHGGLAEIIASHTPPAGFVKAATGEVTTTTATRARWKREAAYIQKKQAEGKFNQCFERIAVGSQAEELKLHQRQFDGDTVWHRNKDAVQWMKRAGHPIATMNPALLSGDSA